MNHSLYERLSEHHDDKGPFICHDGFQANMLTDKLTKRLAYELNRDYVPRPRLADGTLIEHGTWYEGKSDRKPWCVIGIGTGHYDVIAKDHDGTIKPLKSEWLRKPDSLKKLLHDMNSTNLAEFFDHGTQIAKTWCDRLESLIERGA